jgi:peptidyl-prolyl cis-trans isomerase D
MMRTMRENTAVILWILVIAFIGTIVFSWGMGGFDSVSSGNQTTVASINSEDVDIDQYERLITNRLQREQEDGNRPDDSQVQNARKRSWDDLVNLTLERQAVDKLGLTSSDREVSDRVMFMPPEYILADTSLNTAGQFDTLKWHDLLRGPNMARLLQGLESNYRISIPLEKMRARIYSTAHASKADLADDYLQKNQTAKANYLLFEFAKFDIDSADIAESRLKDYYNEHKADYQVDARREIEYLQFEIKPSDEDSLDAIEQVNYIKRQLDNGETFADLASTYSMDNSNAEKGGDLGWFAHGRMVKEFSDAAFAASPGDIVGPIETRFGFHLIKVNGHESKEGPAGEMEDQVSAQHILIKVEASSMTHSDLRAKADAIYEACRNGEDFHLLAAAKELEVKTDKPFSAGGNIPGVGRSQRASDLIFEAKVGEVLNPVYNQRGGWFVIKVKSILPEGADSFENVRKDIVSKVTANSKHKLAEAAANDFIKSHAGLQSIDSTMATDMIKYESLAEAIKINQFVRGSVGRDTKFAARLFTMPVNSVSKPIVGTKGVYIIECTERDDSSALLAEFDKEIDTRYADALSKSKTGSYGRWSSSVKENSVVNDYRVNFGFDY